MAAGSRVRWALAVFCSLLIGLGAGAAGAATITPYSSDADFLANANFVKSFGGNVRWGNAGPSGDWEYSVVDAGDIPLGAGNPLQHAWGAGSNPHQVTFSWDGAGTIILDPSLPAGASTAAGVSAGALDTIAIRARADGGDIADLLAPITISFLDGGADVVVGPLSGDGDAEYIVVTDVRVAGGFTLTANAELGDGSGSIPQYGFKVGVIPEPGTGLLVGLGLAGLAARRRATR